MYNQGNAVSGFLQKRVTYIVLHFEIKRKRPDEGFYMPSNQHFKNDNCTKDNLQGSNNG